MSTGNIAKRAFLLYVGAFILVAGLPMVAEYVVPNIKQLIM